jgi:hypothetical protein
LEDCYHWPPRRRPIGGAVASYVTTDESYMMPDGSCAATSGVVPTQPKLLRTEPRLPENEESYGATGMSRADRIIMIVHGIGDGGTTGVVSSRQLENGRIVFTLPAPR